MRRFGRKLDDEAMRRELPLSVFFFDCLLADAVAFVERPLSERRQALEHAVPKANVRSEEHTSELQSRVDLVCRLLLEKKKDEGQTRIAVAYERDLAGPAGPRLSSFPARRR